MGERGRERERERERPIQLEIEMVLKLNFKSLYSNNYDVCVCECKCYKYKDWFDANECSWHEVWEWCAKPKGLLLRSSMLRWLHLLYIYSDNRLMCLFLCSFTFFWYRESQCQLHSNIHSLDSRSQVFALSWTKIPRISDLCVAVSNHFPCSCLDGGTEKMLTELFAFFL